MDDDAPVLREDIKDKEPKRLVSMKVADVPLECFYKLTDRDGGTQVTKYYRFKNIKITKGGFLKFLVYFLHITFGFFSIIFSFVSFTSFSFSRILFEQTGM